ncbi:MAG: hypothetical protein ACOCV2_02790 [Persicimonas sp.]
MPSLSQAPHTASRFGWPCVAFGTLFLFCVASGVTGCADDSTNSDPWDLDEQHEAEQELTISIYGAQDAIGARHPMDVCVDEPDGCLSMWLYHLDGLGDEQDCSHYCVELPDDWRLDWDVTPHFTPGRSSDASSEREDVVASSVTGTIDFSSEPAPPERIDEISLEVEFEDRPDDFPESLDFKATDVRVE